MFVETILKEERKDKLLSKRKKTLQFLNNFLETRSNNNIIQHYTVNDKIKIDRNFTS